MIYGYIRVSTDKQTVENQRFEISDFCRAVYASTQNEQERNIYFAMLDKLNKR